MKPRKGAEPFLARGGGGGAKAIHGGIGVSYLRPISTITVASGDGPRSLPSDKPETLLPEPQSLHALDWEGGSLSALQL